MKQDTLKFKYRPKRFRNHLYGGIFSVAFGLVFLYFNQELMAYFWLFYGIVFFISYFNSNNFSYIIIDNEGIEVNRFLPKRIKWKDYKGMKFYVGDIRVLSKNKSIDINKKFLNDVDLQIIEEELKARLTSTKM
jgi:hypothetical protein